MVQIHRGAGWDGSYNLKMRGRTERASGPSSLLSAGGVVKTGSADSAAMLYALANGPGSLPVKWPPMHRLLTGCAAGRYEREDVHRRTSLKTCTACERALGG